MEFLGYERSAYSAFAVSEFEYNIFFPHADLLKWKAEKYSTNIKEQYHRKKGFKYSKLTRWERN